MKFGNLFGIEKEKHHINFHILGTEIKIRTKRDYWSKYHEMYKKGNFDLKAKKHFLERWFEDQVGYFPNIDDPKTFDEKIQWYKLYYNDPLIAKCIDKITFKDHIKEVIGSEYVIPTLGTYSNANEINFNELPNQFVIKSNCGSGAEEIIIVNDKSKLDIESTRKTISSWEKPWWRSAWGGYEFIQLRILIEEYIEQIDGQVYDYKFMCFNGEPKYVSVATNRFANRTVDLFDLDWKEQELSPSGASHSEKNLERPKNLPRMIEISRKVSKPFPYVRVDLYDLGDRIYIGELTFYPGGGFSKYNPIEWDYKFGEMLKLPDRLPGKNESEWKERKEF